MSITVTTDNGDRGVVVIPDQQWELLRSTRMNGWTEIVGMADGYSRPIPVDSEAGRILAAIAAAVATSPISDERDKALAERGIVYHFLTSPSRWDAERRWWATKDATVGASFALTYAASRDHYTFSG